MLSYTVQSLPSYPHPVTEHADAEQDDTSPVRSRSNSQTSVDSGDFESPLRARRTAAQRDMALALRAVYAPQSTTVTHYAAVAAGALIAIEGAAAVIAVACGVPLPWVSAGIYLGVGIGFCVAGLLVVGAALWQRSRCEPWSAAHAAPPLPREIASPDWTNPLAYTEEEPTAAGLKAKLDQLPNNLGQILQQALVTRFKDPWSSLPYPKMGTEYWMAEPEVLGLLDALLQQADTLLLGVDAATLRICMHGAQTADLCLHALKLFADGRRTSDDFAAIIQVILAPCPHFAVRLSALQYLSEGPVDATTVFCAHLADRLYATDAPAETIPWLVTHVLWQAGKHSYTQQQAVQVLESALDACQVDRSATWRVLPFLAHVDDQARDSIIESVQVTLHQLEKAQLDALFPGDKAITDPPTYFAAIARFCAAAREHVDDLSVIFNKELPAMVADCAPEHREALSTALIGTYAVDGWKAHYMGSQELPSGRRRCLVERLNDVDAIVQLADRLYRMQLTKDATQPDFFYDFLADTPIKQINELLRLCQIHPGRRPQVTSVLQLLRMKRGELENAFASGGPIPAQPELRPIYLKQERRALLQSLCERYGTTFNGSYRVPSSLTDADQALDAEKV